MRTTRPLHDTSKKRRRTHFLRVLNRQDPATAGQRARRLPRVLSASCAIRIRAHICTCIKADTGRGSNGQHPILEFSLAVSSRLHVHRRRDVERLKLHSYRLQIERERRRGGGGGERAKDRRAKESKGRGPCGYEPAQSLCLDFRFQGPVSIKSSARYIRWIISFLRRIHLCFIWLMIILNLIAGGVVTECVVLKLKFRSLANVGSRYVHLLPPLLMVTSSRANSASCFSRNTTSSLICGNNGSISQTSSGHLSSKEDEENMKA